MFNPNETFIYLSPDAPFRSLNSLHMDGLMQVTINQSLDLWVLCIASGEHVIISWTFTRLMEAIDMASLLQLHVDNVADLPLEQYLNRGVCRAS